MNNPCGPVPLLFITGFLGSGKTTLLNRILDEAAAQGKKIGVIINEWGRVNIDSSLIRAKDIEIEELNDGQVFCSCLSGNFLEALVLLAKRSLDVVIVETSGMANPFPLRNILCDLKRLTGGHYVYQGMIALIDPESFLDLVEDINAVEEQVIASQRIIINKIELADGETLARIRKKIRQLNPHAGIIETSYACVEGILDSSMHEVSTSSPLESKFVKRSAKESYTRPGQYIITTTEEAPRKGWKPLSARSCPELCASRESFRIRSMAGSMWTGSTTRSRRGFWKLAAMNRRLSSFPRRETRSQRN